jgi:hypothetical protein
MGDEKCVKILAGNSEGKKYSRRFVLRWKNGIKIEHTERGCDDVHWICLARDAG